MSSAMKRLAAASLFAFSLACGSSDDETERTTGAASSPPPNPNGALPAFAAGTPGPNGPGIPADFAGTLANSLPLTEKERAAIAAADALAAERNPPKQSPLDRGFGAAPKKGRKP